MQVRLTWQPAIPGSSVAIYDGTSLEASHASMVSAAVGSTFTVPNLTNGTTYYFWLAEAGQPAAMMSGVTAATPSTSVKEPQYCLKADAGDTQVQLTWQPAISGSNDVIYYGTTPNFSPDSESPVAVTGSTATVSDLTGGTTYYFWLAAQAGGVGQFAVQGGAAAQTANPISSAAVATPVSPPASLKATPENGAVSLSWVAPASQGSLPITGYNVYQGTSPGAEASTPVNGSPLSGTSYTVPGLTDGTAYYFDVEAINSAGSSPASPEADAVPVTVPSAPAKLTVTRGDGQVRLSWAAPASDGGSPVTGYDLYAGKSPDFTGQPPLAQLDSPGTVVSGLVNGTTYYFKVAAVNRLGSGAAATATGVPGTVPGVPAGVTATPGREQMTLSWIAPTSDGGSTITGYDVYLGTTPGAESASPVAGSPFAGTSGVVTNLSNGTTYYVRVAAVNAAGQGPMSAELPVVIHSSHPRPRRRRRPAASPSRLAHRRG